MAEVSSSQQSIEVAHGIDPSVYLSQRTAEVAYKSPFVRVSQIDAEIGQEMLSPSVYVSWLFAEVMHRLANPAVRASSLLVEIAWKGDIFVHNTMLGALPVDGGVYSNGTQLGSLPSGGIFRVGVADG